MQFNRFRDDIPIDLESSQISQATETGKGCGTSCKPCKCPKSKIKTEPNSESNPSRIPVPNIDLSFFGTKVSLLGFLCRFTFDLFILFPYYILRTSVVGIYLTMLELRSGLILNALKMFLIHIFDIILPISVVGLISILSAYERDIFYEWSLTCFILFISFILLTSYMSTSLEEENAKKIEIQRSRSTSKNSNENSIINRKEDQPKSWLHKLDHLMEPKHMQKLGLGKLQQMFLSDRTPTTNKLLVSSKSGFLFYI
jgi:hypothetical protein